MGKEASGVSSQTSSQKPSERNAVRLPEPGPDVASELAKMRVLLTHLNSSIGTLSAENAKTQAALAEIKQLLNETTAASTQKTPAKGGSTPQPGARPSPAEQAASGKLKMSEYLESKKSVFDTRVLNSFITAVKQTSKSLLMTDVKFQRPNPLPPGTHLNFTHAARMKLTKGEGSGYMGVGFREHHIDAIVGEIFGAKAHEVTPAMINDMTKEFCNQIFGYAKASLVKEGIEYTITCPEVALGGTLSVREEWGDAYLALIFELKEKPFYILFW